MVSERLAGAEEWWRIVYDLQNCEIQILRNYISMNLKDIAL